MLKKAISFFISIVLLLTVFLNLFTYKSYAKEEIKINTLTTESLVQEATYQDPGLIIQPESDFDGVTVLSKKSVIDQVADRVKLAGANIGLGAIPANYKTTGLTIKNQASTGECWAFSTTSMIEALDLKQGRRVQEYSPRHMDYSCSKSFSARK